MYLHADIMFLQAGTLDRQQPKSMYYSEKELNQEPKPNQTEQNLLEILGEDVKELLEYMVQIKLLRYEILVYFQKFKEKHKAKVDAAMQNEKELIETKE